MRLNTNTENHQTDMDMAKHIILESGQPVNIESVAFAYREEPPSKSPSSSGTDMLGTPEPRRPEYIHYMKVTGVARPIPITETTKRSALQSKKRTRKRDDFRKRFRNSP